MLKENHTHHPTVPDVLRVLLGDAAELQKTETGIRIPEDHSGSLTQTRKWVSVTMFGRGVSEIT